MDILMLGRNVDVPKLIDNLHGCRLRYKSNEKMVGNPDGSNK